MGAGAVVVEGLAEEVGKGELIVDVGGEVVAVGTVETVTLQGEGLAVDVAIGKALTGDVEALLGRGGE